MDKWLAQPRYSFEIQGLNLASGFPVWSLYIRFVLMWISSGYSGLIGRCECQRD